MGSALKHHIPRLGFYVFCEHLVMMKGEMDLYSFCKGANVDASRKECPLTIYGSSPWGQHQRGSLSPCTYRT